MSGEGYLLIGREPSTGKLLVSGKIDNRDVSFVLGDNGSVSNTVSRCVPESDKAHVRLDFGPNGDMRLTNVNPNNVTYVNGNEVDQKRITADSQITLGSDRYVLDLAAVLDTLKKGVTISKDGKKQYDISHLKDVWDNYHEGLINIQEKARRQGLMARVPVFFTLGGGAISGLSVALQWPEWIRIFCIALTVMGLVIMVLTFLSAKNDNSVIERERLTEDFQDNYCCPNPECNKFLGNYSYKMMKKQYSMKCPHCKSEFVEKG